MLLHKYKEKYWPISRHGDLTLASSQWLYVRIGVTKFYQNAIKIKTVSYQNTSSWSRIAKTSRQRARVNKGLTTRPPVDKLELSRHYLFLEMWHSKRSGIRMLPTMTKT